MAFIERITHRTSIDMVRMHQSSKLADMWFAINALKQRKDKCIEVCGCPLHFSCVLQHNK